MPSRARQNITGVDFVPKMLLLFFTALLQPNSVMRQSPHFRLSPMIIRDVRNFRKLWNFRQYLQSFVNFNKVDDSFVNSNKVDEMQLTFRY